jgi:hypothetical protein
VLQSGRQDRIGVPVRRGDGVFGRHGDRT